MLQLSQCEHTYRSWLDAVAAKLPMQQKMMRHSDIRTTMNIYGQCGHSRGEGAKRQARYRSLYFSK